MMELTRSTDYAVRAVVCVAAHDGESRVTANQIAESQGISAKYVPKILSTLVRGGILRTYAGRRGGVVMAKPAERVTLLDVIEAAAGPLALNRCVLGRGLCERIPDCPVHPVWREAQEKLLAVLKRVTVAELAEKAKAGRDAEEKGRLVKEFAPVAEGLRGENAGEGTQAP